MAKLKKEAAATKGTKTTRKSKSMAGQPVAAKQVPASDMDEPQMAAFAEQLGRMVGTMQVRAEDWMNREMLTTQLAAVRDGAAHLLDQIRGLTTAAVAIRKRKKPAPARAVRSGRSGGTVDAPGKKHRKPGPRDPDATLARSQEAKRMAAAMPVTRTGARRGRG